MEEKYFTIKLKDHDKDHLRFNKLTHHMDWLIDFEEYYEISVCDVIVGVKEDIVTISGYVEGLEYDDEFAGMLDFTDWGNIEVLSVEVK